ncbi:Oligosaccharyl transferase STT3 subunit [Methanococcus vannielii SB]|uniref:dolichyl-phosphooligosaccharide-protein glycotransferase n=1 Tax=Methanococcus vannielii (strain ATCC 35089 / DSM 1224 / JCM 13029 / OCM 148 / SB) TaxID=406327 RepID=A6UQ69_METVS|nr:STT3 domain-containing protein [Methanococcus vannielii]ABR54641.1 Oligosaccharyl transferase STT3 subunit [Methanococcus vannielii SB]
MGELTDKISNFFKKNEKIKLFLIILFIGLMSFQIRAQTADMEFTESSYLKEMFSDENGRMYLTGLDPYYYLRQSENYLNSGYSHVGETMLEVDGKKVPYDTIQYAPPGRSVGPASILSVVTVIVYSIWNSIDPTVTMLNAAFWVSPLTSILIGIPVFFIIRRNTLSNIGGLTGAFLIITSPSLLYKTSGGFADTNVFEILPLLFIVWMIMEAIHAQNNLKKSIVFGSLAALFVGIYPLMWSGWWYAFDITASFLVLYTIYEYIIKSKNLKNVSLTSGIFLILGTALVSVTTGISGFFNGILSPIGFTKITESAHAVGWPNVFTTVSELAVPTVNEIIVNSVGDIWLFLAGIFGLILSFVSFRRHKKEYDIKYALYLTLWVLATFYASTKGIRFVALLTPPLAIGIGIFVGQIENILRRYEKKIEYIFYPIIGILSVLTLIKFGSEIPDIILPTTYVPIAVYLSIISGLLLLVYKLSDIISEKDHRVKKIFAVLLSVVIVMPSLAASVPFYVAPTMNNGWKESLDWIGSETPENAVVTCWWDNGHIYTWATRKMVTFDGGSQNTPRAYFVGRAFSTSDEKLATGIFRMLSTSGDSAFDRNSTLFKKTGTVKDTVLILDEILPLNKSDANKVLINTYGLTESESEEVLSLTHPKTTNSNYLITYNRMTDIAPVWSMFGNWDFNLPNSTENSMREMGAYQKLSGSAEVVNGTTVIYVPLQTTSEYSVINVVELTNNEIRTANVVLDSKGQMLQMQNSTFHKLILKVDDKIYENEIDSKGDYSLILRLEKFSEYNYQVYAVVSSKNLENSVYTKLHFLDGYGLDNIKLEKASIDPTNSGVQPGFKVYSVDFGESYLN